MDEHGLPDPQDPTFLWGDYYVPKVHSVKFLQSASAMLVAYSCQQNLFPVFSELENKTNANMKSGFTMATLFCCCLYITIGFISVFMFGKHLEGSVLDNVDGECKPGTGGELHCPWESYIIRILFLIVLACHIPFAFFSGKEAIFIIIDEIDRRSISTVLELRKEILGENTSLPP